MNRPDIKDLPNYLPGIPRQYGLKQPSPKFSQGEDIVIRLNPLYEGKAIEDDKWALQAFIKKGPKAVNILWTGKEHAGLFKDDKGWYIHLPSDASSYFLPGTYHLVVKGRQLIGTEFPVLQNFELQYTFFEIVITPSSPNPKLRAETIIETTYDPETGIWTIKRTSVEPTEPDAISSL